FCQEALVWRQLKHKNILSFLGVNTTLFFPSFCLISPWMDNGNIIRYLKLYPDHNINVVLSDISAGLHYLHSRSPPIIHGDLRGGNILVANDLSCCLADFGLAVAAAVPEISYITSTTSNSKTPVRWLAPEYFRKSNFTNTAREIYAFGCTIVEVITQELPFKECDSDTDVLLSALANERPQRPQSDWCTDKLWDLTTQCWAHKPEQRPSAVKIFHSLSLD
ncbi:kinase-like protein, partial [Gymnopus androsaceus JB14]